MKLTILMFLFSFLGTIASETYSQTTRLSLELKNETVENVLGTIEEKSEYYFLYSAEIIDVNRKVSINVLNSPVEKILDLLFEETNITYTIKGRQVVLSSGKELAVTQQARSVTGRVIDSSDAPLPGVTIVVKRTTQGAITDADGKYSLANVPSDGTLVFSFIGMKTREIPVAGKAIIDVKMEEEAVGIQEVVAIGYGSVKKSDLTGSVASVKANEISAFAAANVLQAMNGRAAGVQVLQNNGAPGGPISIRIRGANSIQGSNDPLFVIDGFPGSPDVLNNSEIERVEILKDASATAIYGSRGANGVILITTKRGEIGKTKVDYESSYGIQTMRKKLDLMNAEEYALFYNEQRANDGLAAYFSQDQINQFGEGFDWQDFVFREASIYRNSVTVSGGTPKTQFSVSGSVFDQQGIIRNSDYNRYSFLTNLKHEISKKFAIDYGIKLTKNVTDRENSNGGNRGSSLLGGTMSAPPTLTPYNDDDSYRNLMTAYPFMSNAIVSPINYLNETMDKSVTNIVHANAAVLFTPIEGLTVKIFGGIENSDFRNDYYQTLKYVNSKGYASVSTSQNVGLLSENTISYTKTFNDKHNLSAFTGFTYENGVSKGLSASGTGFLSDLTETSNLSGASTAGVPSTYYSKSVIMSYLGRINYSYNNKYLLTASFRADGSSKYSEGNKWGYFPSGALAWRVKEESFMKEIAFISDLKMRTSWGITGSQALNPYATLSQLSAGKTVFGKTLYNTFAPGISLPGKLKWETTEQYDIGIDVAFNKGRYKMTADYYVKNTRDLLNTVQLPPTLGYSSTIQNIGQIRNRGLEFSLDARVLDGKFVWDVNGNISLNRSKVVRLHNSQDILTRSVATAFINDVYSILREGKPMYSFYGYIETGYDANGIPTYKDDITKDGAFNTSDRTIIGDPNPDFIYGLTSTMSYKNFDLTMFWQGVYGNDIVNASAIGNTLDYGFGLNMLKEVYTDHWTPQNKDAKYPKITSKLPMYFSRRMIEDGSYLRLRDIQIAYNIPVSKSNIQWLKNAVIYISGQNLLTFTKYSWWDPEVNSSGGSTSLNQGIDYYTYPTAKTISFGLKVGF